LEEPDAQAFFQACNPPADAGSRHAQVGCGMRKARVLDDATENVEIVQISEPAALTRRAFGRSCSPRAPSLHHCFSRSNNTPFISAD
jgi:hypothetical protein